MTQNKTTTNNNNNNNNIENKIEQNDFKLYPRLRSDLKISKMTQRNRTHYVVKDPLKCTYFRFEQEEWDIIKLFDGHKTKEQIVAEYNSEEVNLDTIKEFQESLDSMNLLQKDQHQTNVMLIEKMKEMRKNQLLSKKGSLMYKRFPVVDPDVFFNKIISKINFFWSKYFFVISVSMMLYAIIIILQNWTTFTLGVYDLFSFKNMSLLHAFTLWIIIYITIGIHELGHGLTCKRYGGEVHEIGFLLLFFQPCLYCNVNDAWLFDKKWKQVMVTVAGGYIEFWIGSIFTFIWALTNPNTFLNQISFQVMTICSISTIVANFNPLVKLDGYYLLSDYLEVPNLKEDSGAYIKHLVSKYIFKMSDNEEAFIVSKREIYIFTIYGIASNLWSVFLMLGLVLMAKNIFVEQFYAGGIILTLAVAYKLFNGHFTKGGKFIVQWYFKNMSFFKEKRNRIIIGFATAMFLALLFIPISYRITGDCTLEPSELKVIRAKSEGKLTKFFVQDGEKITNNQPLAQLENFTFSYDEKIAELDVEKTQIKLRQNLEKQSEQITTLKKELLAKELEYNNKHQKLENLNIVNDLQSNQTMVLSNPDQISKINKFFKEGDEICKVLTVDKLFTVIDVPEQEARFLKEKLPIKFKLFSNPLKSYTGHISKVRPSSKSDPINPKRKLYNAEIFIENNGELRPGMMGKAKIYAQNVFVAEYLMLKTATALRLDLFY
ncbi:MAG: efflux RND transporter periplasmic adaptor subunit [Oligoflexia bacterium]|nr:efflux RND transporter periplasmic adaptor subunit [Oligoflexia bacterium]